MAAIEEKRIGWGILGLGRIANTFADCLQYVSDGYVAAAGSRSIEKSREFCEKFGGTPYGSYAEMLKDPDVDVVYVATPHMVHEENVVAAAEAGKAILCEKPFSINSGQTRRMIDAAKANDVFLMEGLWSRFFPAWQYAKKLVHSGDIGAVEAIHSTTCWGKKDLDASNRLLNPDLSGGALLDAGIYSLAANTFIMGTETPKVSSTMRIGCTGVDETTSLMLDYGGKTASLITCSIFGWSFNTVIICEKATVYIPRHRNPDTVIIRKRIQGIPVVKGEEEALSFPFENEGFQFEAAHVQECLRKGLKESPEAPLAETMLLSQICTEVRERAGFVYPFE